MMTMGLDVYLTDGTESVEEKSDKYPEHYCNKGYLRSSYNSSGFNSVANQLIGKDMYYIFQPLEPSYTGNEEEDEDAFYVPYPKKHLKEALERAKEVIKEMKEAPPYRAMTVSAKNIFQQEDNVTTSSEALKIFQKELERNSQGGYQNREGYFFQGDPIEIVAAIPGIDTFNQPSVHLIYKSEDGMKYYIEQAEIIREFIEKAISLEDPRIGWSS